MAFQYPTILPLDRKTFYREKRWQPIKTRGVKIAYLSKQLNTVTRKAEVVSSVPGTSKEARKSHDSISRGVCFQT